jgi:hypothetical protein
MANEKKQEPKYRAVIDDGILICANTIADLMQNSFDALMDDEGGIQPDAMPENISVDEKNLFQLGDFTSHGGAILPWKIECDALSEADWDCIARMIADKYKFKEVRGIPQGGIPLQKALEKYADPNSDILLLVDDIYTTGCSMGEYRAQWIDEMLSYAQTNIRGVVLFARNPITQDWIKPIFQYVL